MARKGSSSTARVQKGFSTGGIPGVSGAGSNFQLGKVVNANGAGPGGAAGSSKYPGGIGAIGNSSGIPAGAK